MKRWLLRLALPVSLALSIATPLWFGGVEALAEAAAFSPALSLLALALLLASFAARGLRLALLARGLGYRLGFTRANAIVVAGEFGSMTTPAGVGGHALLIWLLNRRGLRVDQGTALVAGDQIFDMLFFMLALPMAAVLAGGKGDFPVLSAAGAALVTVLLVVLVHTNYRRLCRWSPRLLGEDSPRLRRWLRYWLQFHRALARLRQLRWRSLFALGLLTVTQWLARYGILPLIFLDLALEPRAAYLFLAQALALTGGMLTMLPGGGGGVEAAMLAMVHDVGPPAQIAGAVLIWRVIIFYAALLIAAPVAFKLAIRKPVYA